MKIAQLKENLESECDYLRWNELEKHFARGVIRVISKDSNLISMAIDIAQNNTSNISTALASKRLFEPSNAQALSWQQLNSNFLCVVVAPFVLIQESNSEIGIVKT